MTGKLGSLPHDQMLDDAGDTPPWMRYGVRCDG